MRSQRILLRAQTLQSVALDPAAVFSFALLFIVYLATCTEGSWGNHRFFMIHTYAMFFARGYRTVRLRVKRRLMCHKLVRPVSPIGPGGAVNEQVEQREWNQAEKDLTIGHI